MIEIRNIPARIALTKTEKKFLKTEADKVHLSMTEFIVQAIQHFADYIKNGGEVKR